VIAVTKVQSLASRDESGAGGHYNLSLNLHALAVKVLRSDPSIDEPGVVADLIASVLNGFDDVQILVFVTSSVK